MIGTESRQFKAVEASHKAAKARVTAALTGKSDTDADRLVRWMFNADVPPKDVFVSPGVSAQFATFEGIAQVITALDAAISRGRSVAFVRTVGAGPRVMFLNPKDRAFKKVFASEVRLNGYPPEVLDIFQIAGFLDDVDGVIAEHKAHEDRRRRLVDSLSVFQKA